MVQSAQLGFSTSPPTSTAQTPRLLAKSLATNSSNTLKVNRDRTGGFIWYKALLFDTSLSCCSEENDHTASSLPISKKSQTHLIARRRLFFQQLPLCEFLPQTGGCLCQTITIVSELSIIRAAPSIRLSLDSIGQQTNQLYRRLG